MDLGQQETGLPREPALAAAARDAGSAVTAMEQPVGVARLAATAALRYSNLGLGPLFGRGLGVKCLNFFGHVGFALNFSPIIGV
jgi:hypothetical protein